MRIAEVVRNTLVAAFTAALVGGAARVLGLDGPHALAVGGGVLALVLVLLAQRSATPVADLEPHSGDAPTGGRRDVEQLAWSMVEHRTHVRGIVLTRVRAIAAVRLAGHGLDLRRTDDLPAIRTLLGADAWSVLDPDRERPVTPRALDAALTALERLPPPAPLAAARARSSDRTSRAD